MLDIFFIICPLSSQPTNKLAKYFSTLVIVLATGMAFGLKKPASVA